jgi:alpha-1,2-mannosyltransferase
MRVLRDCRQECGGHARTKTVNGHYTSSRTPQPDAGSATAAQVTVAREAQPGIKQSRMVSPWVRRGGPAVLAAALLLYLAAYVRWPVFALQIDALVYRFGAVRVLHGLDLYSVGFTGTPDELLFIYPPFAALCFLPLAFLSRLSAQILSLILMCVLLTYAVQRMLRWFGLAATNGLWALTALLVGLLAWLEPVRLSVQLGQINIAILVVVLADLLGPQRRKWAGIGIGLVAGVKLTPAIFIIYLVLIGRLRAALVAAATLAGTILVGFAVLPKDSSTYWLNRRFEDVGRISRDPIANASARGLFVRMHYSTALATVVAIVLVAAALAVAAIAYRRGHAVLAIAIVGMASAAASPFSWSHHWVWFAPLLVHLGYRAYVLSSTYSAWTMWIFWALFASWFTSFASSSPGAGLLSLRPGGVLDEIIPGAYVFAMLAMLVWTAAWLWRSAPDADTTSGREPHTAWLTGAARVVPRVRRNVDAGDVPEAVSAGHATTTPTGSDADKPG